MMVLANEQIIYLILFLKIHTAGETKVAAVADPGAETLGMEVDEPVPEAESTVADADYIQAVLEGLPAGDKQGSVPSKSDPNPKDSSSSGKQSSDSKKADPKKK